MSHTDNADDTLIMHRQTDLSSFEIYFYLYVAELKKLQDEYEIVYFATEYTTDMREQKFHIDPIWITNLVYYRSFLVANDCPERCQRSWNMFLRTFQVMLIIEHAIADDTLTQGSFENAMGVFTQFGYAINGKQEPKGWVK